MDVKVRKSGIHGMGVFATRAFTSGELIGIYEGRMITYHPEGREKYYVLWVEDDEGRFFGILGDGDLRFMNHSDEPNCTVAEGGPFVYCRYPIAKGDEITITYGEEWEAPEGES